MSQWNLLRDLFSFQITKWVPILDLFNIFCVYTELDKNVTLNTLKFDMSINALG